MNYGVISMNYLVFLDARAGELEKILSGTKTMVIKEFDPAQSTAHPVHPDDSLYFLRDKDDCALRVKATVVRILFFTSDLDQDLPHTLKEMQTKLQFTEDLYNYWSAKEHVLLVEFGSAQKIGAIHVATQKIMDRSDWIAFEGFSLITEQRVSE
jgi:hypothetical protein